MVKPDNVMQDLLGHRMTFSDFIPESRQCTLHAGQTLAQAFARANRTDRMSHGRAGARLVIATAGKAWLDVSQALDDLGLEKYCYFIDMNSITLRPLAAAGSTSLRGLAAVDGGDMAEAEAWKLMEQTRVEWTARVPADGAALIGAQPPTAAGAAAGTANSSSASKPSSRPSSNGSAGCAGCWLIS